MQKPGLILDFPQSFDFLGQSDLINSVILGVGDLEIASLRLRSAGFTRVALVERVQYLGDLARAHDLPLVLDDQGALALELELDGVHLTQPNPKELRRLRELLGPHKIIGAYCGDSRHDGMIMGEIGADYISFGPVGDDGSGKASVSEAHLSWWADIIEIPLVIEGGIDSEAVSRLGAYVDYLTLGAELWSDRDPLAFIKALRLDTL